MRDSLSRGLRLATFAALLAGGAVRAGAQTVPDGVSLTGAVRFRLEAIDGQARTGANSSDQLAQLRTQVKASWQHDWLQAVVEVHDSRAWGANSATPLSTGEVNTLEPVQAYLRANLGAIAGPGSSASVQAGRFTLALGSSRLVANDDYRNTTNAFTGLRADVATRSGFKATAIYVLPLARLPDDGPSLRDNRPELDRESFSTVLWGAFLSRKAKGSRLLQEVSFLHLGERDWAGHPTRDRSLNTAGARLLSDPRPGAFDWGVEGIYQWGGISASTAPNAARLDVSATFVKFQAGYSFRGAWHPRLLVEFDRASGDGTGGTYGRFDPLYGSRRAELAPSGLYSALARTNILSPGARVEVTPSARVDGFVGYRALWLADSHDAFAGTGVRDASGRSGSFAGHQFDMRVRWWLVPKRLRFEADAVLLAKGSFLRNAPNATPGATTRYGSLNLTASF